MTAVPVSKSAHDMLFYVGDCARAVLQIEIDDFVSKPCIRIVCW